MDQLKKQVVPFTQVANEVLNDSKLSFKAKGLFAYLYSKPKNWNFSYRRIANDTRDGKDSVLSGLHELQEQGYLTINKLSSGRSEYKLNHALAGKPGQGPEPENPSDGKSHGGKIRPISNKDIEVIKSISNKEIAKPTPKQINQAFFAKQEPYQEWLSFIAEQPNRIAIEKETEKFIFYWTEPNSTGKKLRWEMQKTFDVKRRLATWMNRSNTNYKAQANKYQRQRV